MNGIWIFAACWGVVFAAISPILVTAWRGWR